MKLCKVIVHITAEDTHVDNGNIRLTLGKSPDGKFFGNHVCGSSLKNIIWESDVSHCSYLWLLEAASGSFGISSCIASTLWSNIELKTTDKMKQLQKHKEALMVEVWDRNECLVPCAKDLITSWGHLWAKTTTFQIFKAKHLIWGRKSSLGIWQCKSRAALPMVCPAHLPSIGWKNDGYVDIFIWGK